LEVALCQPNYKRRQDAEFETENERRCLFVCLLPIILTPLHTRRSPPRGQHFRL